MVTPSNLPDATEEAEERPSNEDNSSDLDDSPGTEEPEIDRSHTGFSASDSRAIAQELQGSFITDLSHLSAVPPPGKTQGTAISEVILNSRIQSKKRSGLTGPVSLTYERLEIATSPSSNRLCFNTSAKVQQTPRHRACHRQYCLPGKRREFDETRSNVLDGGARRRCSTTVFDDGARRRGSATVLSVHGARRRGPDDGALRENESNPAIPTTRSLCTFVDCCISCQRPRPNVYPYGLRPLRAISSEPSDRPHKEGGHESGRQVLSVGSCGPPRSSQRPSTPSRGTGYAART